RRVGTGDGDVEGRARTVEALRLVPQDAALLEREQRDRARPRALHEQLRRLAGLVLRLVEEERHLLARVRRRARLAVDPPIGPGPVRNARIVVSVDDGHDAIVAALRDA